MILKNKHHGINTSFKRNGKFPIDADSLFSSLEAANEYLNIELTSAIPATIIGIYNEQDSSENGVYEVVKTERGLELFKLSRQESNLTQEDISNAVAQLNSKVNKLSDDQTQLSDNLVQSTQSLQQLIDSVKSDINDINNEINVQKPSIESINNKISDISKILNNLQKQVDDDIEFWYGSGNPLPYQSGEDIISSEEGANVYPYTQWDEYESHVGDIYLNSTDGSAWRFVYQNQGYWIRIADELSGKVLQQISQLYNLIDETKALIPINVSQLNNDVGYLTEHQSLEDYVLKNSLPDFNSFALKTDIKDFVTNSTFLEYKTFISNNYFSKTDITGYATQDWVNAQGFLKDFTIPDNYATKEWVLDKGYISSSEPVDLSNYALKNHEHTEYAIKNHNHTQYASSDHTHDQYALKTDLPDFSIFALKTEIPSLKTIDGNSLIGVGDIPLKTINGNSLIGNGDIKISSSGSIDLSNYVLKSELPNFENYATKVWVNSQGFITQLKTINGNSLTGSGDIKLKTINGIPIIGNGDISISSSGTVDLSGYALKDHTHINNTKFILRRTYPSYFPVDIYNNIYWNGDTMSNEVNLYYDDELVYISDDGKALKWTITGMFDNNNNNNSNNINFVRIDNRPNYPVYLYFKCPKYGTNGILYSSVTPINSNDSEYFFLFGVVLTNTPDYIIIEDVRSGVRFINKIVSGKNSALLRNDMTTYIDELNDPTDPFTPK